MRADLDIFLCRKAYAANSRGLIWKSRHIFRAKITGKVDSSRVDKTTVKNLAQGEANNRHLGLEQGLSWLSDINCERL